MKYLKYLGVRAVFFVPQIIGIVLIAFVFVRLIPGDPARLMAGPLVPESGVEKIREQMGLTGSLPSQFVHYVGNVVQGDLGISPGTRATQSARTSRPGLPATLELIVISLASDPPGRGAAGSEVRLGRQEPDERRWLGAACSGTGCWPEPFPTSGSDSSSSSSSTFSCSGRLLLSGSSTSACLHRRRSPAPT